MRLRDAEKMLKEAEEASRKAELAVVSARETLIEAKSRQRFQCYNADCNRTSAYRDITLYEMEWTRKGLGYEDDVDLFCEWHIECPHCKIHHRFLSDESILKYEIPHKRERNPYSWNDNDIFKIKQTQKNCRDFTFNFKEVKVMNIHDGSFTRRYRFLNL